jgi:hypothetical protein
VQPEGSYTVIYKGSALLRCIEAFSEWHKNRRFQAHLRLVDEQLQRIQSPPVKYPWPRASLQCSSTPYHYQSAPGLEKLLSHGGRLYSAEITKTGIAVSPLVLQPAAVAMNSENDASLTLLADTHSTELYAQRLCLDPTLKSGCSQIS